MAVKSMFCAGLFAIFAAGLSNCTVDDEVIEGKKCVRSISDPNKDCIKGYECLCEQSVCFCRKKADGLAEQVSVSSKTEDFVSENPSPAAPSAFAVADPNYLFLQRLGMFQE